jgi:cullin-associated NEDD8-dissociated protein 1
MASTVTNPTVPGIVSLLGKIGDPDPDFRFMSLQDLLDVLTNCRPEFLASNHTLALRCLDEIIKTLDDTNGEVQGVAMKW